AVNWPCACVLDVNAACWEQWSPRGPGSPHAKQARPMIVPQEREEMMAERLGIGEWTFEVEENWAKIPDAIVLGDVAAVGIDSKGMSTPSIAGRIPSRCSTRTAPCCAPGAKASLPGPIASRTPSSFMSGEPFHHCTHTTLSPECDHLYISDG